MGVSPCRHCQCWLRCQLEAQSGIVTDFCSLSSRIFSAVNLLQSLKNCTKCGLHYLWKGQGKQRRCPQPRNGILDVARERKRKKIVTQHRQFVIGDPDLNLDRLSLAWNYFRKVKSDPADSGCVRQFAIRRKVKSGRVHYEYAVRKFILQTKDLFGL